MNHTETKLDQMIEQPDLFAVPQCVQELAEELRTLRRIIHAAGVCSLDYDGSEVSTRQMLEGLIRREREQEESDD